MKSIEALQAKFPDLGPEQTVIVGVSGGRDSVVLLHFLQHTLNWRSIVVAHVNHQLRGKASDQDAEFVKELAAKHALLFESICVEVKKLAAERKISLETAGREARGFFFQSLSRKYQTPYVFLAHHADDQAETLLSNLCRGTSTKGLVGMKIAQTTSHGWIKLRPLLNCRRAWINAYARQHVLDFREDESNAVADVRRNRLRLEVIPLLTEIFSRDVSQSLIKLQQLAAIDEDFFSTEVQRWFASADFYSADSPYEIKLLPDFLNLHEAMQQRLLHHWLTLISIPDISLALLTRVTAMTKPDGPTKLNLPGNQFLRRKRKRLFIEKPIS